MVLREGSNRIDDINSLKKICKGLEAQLDYLHLRNMELERLLSKAGEDRDEELLEHQVTEKLLDQHKDALAEAYSRLKILSKTIQTQSIALDAMNEERKKLLNTLCERDKFVIKLYESNADSVSIPNNETFQDKYTSREN